MQKEKKMILDHIENLKIKGDEDFLHDAKMTLAQLSNSMFWLYEKVKMAEDQVIEKAKNNNVELIWVGGELSEVLSPWLSTSFQWYSISLCNYVQLVGWMTTRKPNYAKKYLKKIAPRLLTYRNKIGAHFAITDPRKDDNQSDKISSIMTSIVFANGHLRAGAISEEVTDSAGNVVKASNKTSWSLINKHKEFVKRFWPSGPIPFHSSIKISPGKTRKINIDWGD